MNFEAYEREKREVYADLAETVATILVAAIKAEADYRLQQVKARAKQPDSLRKKLENRGALAIETLEDEIKDLAGCRIVFYTNNDVSRLINSGVIEQNFEVVERKVHHPGREIEHANELYTSNHYVVSLKPERTALPEYADFAGMKCEIQIQTILNHAWAEMAHDTIYKAPALEGFGAQAFERIERRLQKVAQKYLVPAGFEFQAIATDFQRLLDGKNIFDEGNVLDEIVNAADNNVRFEALEKFNESVVPFYDDPQAVYPDIARNLIAAVKRAKETAPVPVETPYGVIPPKEFKDIVSGVVDILAPYRYVDVDITFDTLLAIYSEAVNDEEAVEKLLKLADSLASHNMKVWRSYGPFVQTVLVGNIRSLTDEQLFNARAVVTEILGKVLGTEIQGTISHSDSIELQRGAVIASDDLRNTRAGAIEQLKRLFALVDSELDKKRIFQALHSGLRPPISTGYSNELAHLVMQNITDVIGFEASVVAELSLSLRQSIESWVNRVYWTYEALPESMAGDASLVAAQQAIRGAALNFRDVSNADPDFVIYKTLVGYDCVYPPAWSDRNFQYSEATAYRNVQVDALLGTVTGADAELWFDRLRRYAQTDSEDLATFPVFAQFIERLGESQPEIVFDYVDRAEPPLKDFLPAMFAGLMRSARREDILGKIESWLASGDNLELVAWYLRTAEPFDESLLRKTLDSAIHHGNSKAVRTCLLAALMQFRKAPGDLIRQVFLPAIRYFQPNNDFAWVHLPVFSWYRNELIKALDENQAAFVLEALVPYPEWGGSAEQIVSDIAYHHPAKVIHFLRQRVEFKNAGVAPDRYDVLPFSPHDLKAPLAEVPDLMLDAARGWYAIDPDFFHYDGGRLLAAIFPDLSKGLDARLEAIVDGQNKNDLEFVISVLSAFEGRPCIYPLARKIVTLLPLNDALLKDVDFALGESGVVTGEFGFAELYGGRKALLEPWLNDPSETVQAFARERIRTLEQQIATENRSAATSSALRKLRFGEDL